MASGIIFARYSNKNNSYIEKSVWLCYSLACLSWAIADVTWIIYELSPKLDPEASLLITYMYTLTNVFIIGGVIIYGIYTFKKWNMIQLLVDSAVTSATSILLIWILYLNKSSDMIDKIIKDGWISGISILFDILILVGIFIWFISVRQGGLPKSVRISATGILIYALVDLIYYYIYFYNVYVPNSLIDSVYMGAILCIAVGSMFARESKQVVSMNVNQVGYKNIKIRYKGLLFFIAPILIFIDEGFVLIDLLIFLIPVVVHQTLSVYIQGSVQNEILLEKQKELNKKLESKIDRRTVEIIQKNIELESKNKELAFLSNQDTLTNLHNRRFFLNKLDEDIKYLDPTETIGLLFIDVDRFKTINDTYGHDIGDQLIFILSKRLQAMINGYEILARLGGDEFVIGFKGNYEYEQLEDIANKIIDKCSEEIEIDQYIFKVGISVGIAIYPIDSKDSQTLMKNADIAMYQAKALGRGKCVSYDSVFTTVLHRKNEIEILLRKANFDEEFELFYQPQFSIPDNNLIGVEALLRWNVPDIGYISPAEFIPIAEEINYINPIGEWVLRHAICQIGEWNREYSVDFKMGINVSPKQLDNKNLIKILKETLEKEAVLAKTIDIEITESIAIEGEYRIKQIDSIFEGLDVSISIDDFGTGYSSLSYLKFFPFERIKIAKPLIDVIATVNYDLEIVKAIIMLAKSIGIKTIAEGVETKEQYDILVELGCDEIQGYYFDKPLPVSKFKEKYL
jgi:diguanylate cyclase (GGDEF)-like protein